MNIVNLDKVSKVYAAGPIFDNVSLGVDEADRIGVVGLNGAGKSTLLKLILGTVEPDSGRVTRRRDTRISALPQQVSFPDGTTVRDVVLGTAWLAEGFDAEHEWASDAGIRGILAGLGMPGLGLDAELAPMSGGERRRVALAALLIRSADLLILDEPTNHLDVAGIAWLAAFLNERKGALLVVTHDRWFLDAVCGRTWEVADATVRAYEGGYAAWILARAERQRVASEVESKRQNLLRKEIAWLRRGAPARTSKPKFRIDAANALIADVPEPRESVSLKKMATARLGKDVYGLADVTVRLGDRTLLSHVDWIVGPGDRIGLVGVNGAGKTTLLRLLAGVSEPTEGEVSIGKTVKTAFLSQELSELPGELRVLEAVEEVARRVVLGDKEMSAGQVAEVFGFTDRRLWTPVKDLSGGERRRLQLLRLLATEPNVLILDEPTNDLDTDTLASLEDLLDTWPGTIVVASHDRYLMERVCDQVYALMGDGKVTHLPHGIDEFLERVGAGGQVGGRLGATAAEPQQAKATVERAGLSAAEARVAKKEMARLERTIQKLEQREEKLHAQLAEHATDYSKITELQADLSAIVAEKESAEEEWLSLAEQVGE
ncbi:ABC-F family ATP-binding cassette domain-containing protein [Longispora albida]|uniref:ABC-F family ATP-binding cassette domain-containing protein n=1 Tax=Longispora albida TaxID=203523 RepID=UPI0003726CBD|nr:ABC-F family ATP-binding cassette domain-containing protein [Longispora albida]